MVDWTINELINKLIDKLFSFISDLIETPLQPLLSLSEKLLIEPVIFSIFKNLWYIMVYIISLFYGLFFLFSGFNFIIAGFDIERKEKAKSWIKNTILMIIFVQASWILYGLLIDMSSLLSSGVMGLIDPNFFEVNIDNFASLGLNLLLVSSYGLTLLSTVVLLGIRYILVSFGVVFFPIGLFLYFIPPLRSYGQLIINVLGTLIFIPFFLVLVLLGSSMLMDLAVFSGFNIILASSAFLLINTIIVLLLLFTIIKSAFSVINSDVGRNVKSAVKYFV